MTKIEFYKFSYSSTNMGVTGRQTRYVAISKGSMKEVQKFFKKEFRSFKEFEKSSEADFMYADVESCYVNTKVLGKGFSPLYKKEGLKMIGESSFKSLFTEDINKTKGSK